MKMLKPPKYQKKRKHKKLLLILPLVLIVPVFFVIMSSNVEKPDIKKPKVILTNNLNLKNNVTPEHIEYLVNEIGGYKLHDDPISKEEPRMEIYITDLDERFSIIIEDNIPTVQPILIDDPDLRISGKSNNILELMQIYNLNEGIIEMVQQRKIKVEILADEKTLILKGYKAIYDELVK